MTTENIIHGLRIYSVATSAVVAILGTFQVKRWRRYLVENQLAWLAIAVLNASVFFSTVQTLHEHAPGGERNYVIALAVTFEFYAVAYHPVRALWRRWHVRRIVRKANRRNALG